MIAKTTPFSVSTLCFADFTKKETLYNSFYMIHFAYTMCAVFLQKK